MVSLGEERKSSVFYPCMFLSTSKPVPLDEKKKGQVKIVLRHVCVYVVFSLNT